MTVTIFHGHRQEPCTHGPDDERSCARCQGLYSCSVCGGAEASLPTDCPGGRMPAIVQDEIQDGHLDYRRVGGFTLLQPRRMVRSHQPGDDA